MLTDHNEQGESEMGVGSTSDVAVAIVTFNRLPLLQQLLASLDAQTHPVKRLIIIDNNSSDGTREFLEHEQAQRGDISVKLLRENLGGAGGFEAAFEFAKQVGGWDLLWVMDDDAAPEPGCLFTLLQEKARIPDASAVMCPLVVGLNGPQIYHHKTMDKWLIEHPVKLDKRNLIPLDCTCFVGPLFPRSVVDEVGAPRGDYFIWFDDVDYTYRTSRKFPLYLATDAVIRHYDQQAGQRLPIRVFWKQYYGLRNRILFAKRFRKGKVLPIALYHTLRALASCIVKDDHKIRRVSLLIRAVVHGLIGKSGKTLDPQVWIASVQR